MEPQGMVVPHPQVSLVPQGMVVPHPQDSQVPLGMVDNQVLELNLRDTVLPHHKVCISPQSPPLSSASCLFMFLRQPILHRGSYMSAHVLLILLYKLGKRDKM